MWKVKTCIWFFSAIKCSKSSFGWKILWLLLQAKTWTFDAGILIRISSSLPFVPFDNLFLEASCSWVTHHWTRISFPAIAELQISDSSGKCLFPTAGKMTFQIQELICYRCWTSPDSDLNSEPITTSEMKLLLFPSWLTWIQNILN